MNAKGKFISSLVVIDTFFISFAAGFNSRHVPVVDPSLPPVVQPKKPVKSPAVPKEQPKGKKAEHPSASQGAKAHPKKHNHPKAKPTHGVN